MSAIIAEVVELLDAVEQEMEAPSANATPVTV